MRVSAPSNYRSPPALRAACRCRRRQMATSRRQASRCSSTPMATGCRQWPNSFTCPNELPGPRPRNAWPGVPADRGLSLERAITVGKLERGRPCLQEGLRQDEDGRSTTPAAEQSDSKDDVSTDLETHSCRFLGPTSAGGHERLRDIVGRSALSVFPGIAGDQTSAGPRLGRA
jgi:hypothetical protein